MPDARQKQPWERQPGEPRKHYSYFLAYRDLGPARTVRNALRDTPRIRGGCGRAAWDELPKKVQDGLWSYRRKLAARWHWTDRANAWDDWRNSLAQKHADERAAEAAIREADEAEEERRRQIEAGRKAVAAGSHVVTRLVELYEKGALDDVSLERVKNIVIAEDGNREETERKAITELLPAALAALAEGQRMQRVAQEQATDKREIKVDLSGFERLAEIIVAHVPEEQWDDVRAEVGALLRGEDVGDDA